MNMFTKDEEKENDEFRCVAWVKDLPKDKQEYFCQHGRYWGFKGALRFMSPCCKP